MTLLSPLLVAALRSPCTDTILYNFNRITRIESVELDEQVKQVSLHR